LLARYRDRRLAREPVSRILGRREFWGLSFSVSEATLDPRPDSEVLVEEAIAALDGCANPRVLDLGTGTGCLLLAILSDIAGATGIGVDISPEAVSMARVNALQLGLEHKAAFHQGDWMDGLDERFDLVISNPPYIPCADIVGLEPEVRTFDPQAALDGGADGLDAYRLLADGLGRVLKSGGMAIIELGAGQAEAVSGLFLAAGLGIECIADDLGGVPRALIVTN
ncbi:MAG TPA: peptide chain release factor N(5)-glutamine methyltransferase, partial [Rhizobium sp.]